MGHMKNIAVMLHDAGIDQEPNDAQAAALALAARGWSVIPLRAGSKRPVDAWKRWQYECADAEQIMGWFGDRSLNIGVVTGATSGIVVVDLDSPGAHVWAGAEGIADTLICATPRGSHLFFQHPGVKIPNGQDVLTYVGCDVRGDGGYVVASGSTVNGRPYSWANRQPIAPMPQWMVDRLT